MPTKKDLLFPDKEKITISARIPARLLERIDESAAYYDVTRSQVINAILDKYYNK